MIQIKRAYKTASKTDGCRVLVDRLWPRGLSKDQLVLHQWMKDIAPSNELRKKFGHDPKRWKSFVSNYKKELCNPEAKEQMKLLVELAQKKKLTLVYGAKDEEHNNAVVLKSMIEKS
jgi:uncharacterized protein YeaO (DUF488 family)